MVDQPIGCSGQRQSMRALHQREGIMATQVSQPPNIISSRPLSDLLCGTFPSSPSSFEDPQEY